MTSATPVHVLERASGYAPHPWGIDLLLTDAKARLGSPTPQIEIYTTVYEGTHALLTRWADRIAAWRIDTLRLQHQIWLRTAQRPVSEQLIREAIGDSTFFRSDVDTYCSRELATKTYPFRVEFHPPLPVHEMVEFYRNP